MNPDYLYKWPESYPITLDAVREHLYGRPRIGDPAAWRRCAEFFAAPYCAVLYGICGWMDCKHTPGHKLEGSVYSDISAFFRHIAPNRGWIWPTHRDFAPRRAALCRTVAALLEELQLNPPADESIH